MRRLRIPSWDLEGANPNSTTFPANSRRVQWPCPSGAGLQAKARPRPRPGGDEAGLAPVVQLPRPLGLGPVLQNPCQPFLSEAPLDAEHRAFRNVQCSSHLGGAPSFVGLEQNPRPSRYPGRAFPSANQMLELLPFFRSQPHYILFLDHHRHPIHHRFHPPSVIPLGKVLNN